MPANTIMTAARIQKLYRYPVKGLSPEPLTRAELSAGSYFPGDRLFAIENGPSGFDAVAPQHQPKIKFLMLMRNERLARLRTRYEPATHTLTIEQDGAEMVRVDIASPEGHAAIASFFRTFMPDELRGPPQVLAAPEGFRFTDNPRGFVSIINLASVAAVEGLVGAAVNPLRFRANVYVTGWPAWAEFDLMDREVQIGHARVRVHKRIKRCAATNVDPEVGVRDLTIPDALIAAFGHQDCGVYAEVLTGGSVAVGDTVSEAAPLPH
jgi:uncharacterized protein YcbX